MKSQEIVQSIAIYEKRIPGRMDSVTKLDFYFNDEKTCGLQVEFCQTGIRWSQKFTKVSGHVPDSHGPVVIIMSEDDTVEIWNGSIHEKLQGKKGLFKKFPF